MILDLKVLHQNKGNGYARGHLGSELTNKAEIIMEVSKYQKEGLFEVRPLDTRGFPFEPFAFKIQNDLPTLTDLPKSSPSARKPDLGSIEESDQKMLLMKVFWDKESFNRGDLIREIKSAFEEVHEVPIGDNKVKEFITRCKEKGWLIQEKARAPYTLNPAIKNSEDE